MDEPKTGEGERLVKLALYIRENAPVSFVEIRRGLHEYAFFEGPDTDAARKHDQAVRRMFERDKATLEECGLRIVADADNRYSVDAQASYATPVDLTPGQASTLRLVAAALLEDPSYPLKAQLRMVLAKIGDELDVPDMLPGASGEAAGRAPSGLAKVQKALAERRRLRFSYESANGEHSEREVEPFGCFFLNRRCYVVAFDPQAGQGGAERVFRLDRMRRLNVAGGKGADFEERPFDVSAWRKHPFQYGSGRFEATVRFDGACAWRAAALAEGVGMLEERGDCTLWHVESGDAAKLAAWCIENGPGVQPSAPQDAVEAYRRGVASALERVTGGAR